MQDELTEEQLIAFLRGEVENKPRTTEEEMLLTQLSELAVDLEPDVEPRPEKNDPARYVWAYRQGNMYRFLPQSELDIFCAKVEKQISVSFNGNVSDYVQAKADFGSTIYEDDPLSTYEARHDELRDIARAELSAHEDVQRLQLLDELRVISIYRSIEIARNRRLLEVFPDLEKRKLHQVTYLRKAVPFWKQVFGLAEIDELRIINNCIKHSGIISKQLEGCHSQWEGREGQPFHDYLDEGAVTNPPRPLRDAYQRIAPFVGAYWNNFLELASEHKKGGDN